MLKEKCDFCQEFSGNVENSFDRIYQGKPAARALFRSNHFAVVPSLGHFVEGYLLILPTKHFNAIGDLAGDHLSEFVSVCEAVAKVLREQYGPHVFFEHGVRSEGAGGCGIYHAHLHAVPLGGASDPVDILTESFRFVPLTHFSEIHQRSAGLLSYLFYQDSNGRSYVFDSGTLPSQYMRKLLAPRLNVPDWNWRTAGREDRLLATIERLSGQFAKSMET